MDKDWVVVRSSTLLYEIELYKQILHLEGIESVVLNQQDSAYVSIGDIKLLVKNTDAIRAKNIISKSET